MFNHKEGVIVTNETTTVEESNSKKQMMKLPYTGEENRSIRKSLKKQRKQFQLI